jgi:CRP-like cAMP-binding protein
LHPHESFTCMLSKQSTVRRLRPSTVNPFSIPGFGMDKTASFLRNTEVFKGLNDDSLLEVSRLFKRLSLNEGSQIVRLGDESDSVFLIEKGHCKVSIPFDFNMGENILSYLSEGDLFGEMGIITKNRRVANITCFTDVEVLVMSGEDFWKIAEKHSIVLKNIIATLSERLVAQNIGKRAQKRAPLNLNDKQREALKNFYRFIRDQNQNLIDRMMNARVPRRKFRWTPLKPVRRLAYAIFCFMVNICSAPYVSNIRDAGKVEAGKPAIFLLSFRTHFDFLFFIRAHRHLDPDRRLTYAFRAGNMRRAWFFLLRGLFSLLQFTYLGRQHGDPTMGAEDPTNFLMQRGESKGTVDVALHPFPKRSMRYDKMMAYDHFNIWLGTGGERDLIPVVIRGTDKFWPFEPWNRKFFDIPAFFSFKSVDIQFGQSISLKEMGFGEEFEACGGDREKITQLFDRTNSLIGNRLAELDGHQYMPQSETAELEVLRAFNEKWSSRLSLMLHSGLGLRKKYGRSSVRIRHFVWHAEMLDVLLEHLEEEKFILPDWAKGMLIAGASFPDLDWPFFSMDHSYNPYTGKGMKLVVRFPALMKLIRKETASLSKFLEKGYSVEKVLTMLGRLYHFMSDLAVPAHVHNIPHMFLDLPKIGKCDFEEYLGLDPQLVKLHEHDIGDISAVRVESMEDFYRSLDDMAKYTFLNSSFTFQQLKSIARDRMITTYSDKDDLIKKMRKMGVTVLPVEGCEDEERFYVRNLTSSECDEIGKKTTLYSLKTVAACFLFLISMLNEKFMAAGKQPLSGQ